MNNKFNKRITQLKNTRKKIQDALRGNRPAQVQGNAVVAESVVVQPGEFTLRVNSLKELRVAAIMDRFTLECFRPECQLMELTPDGWQEEMASFKPDLLFVESAWEGKDGLWHGKVNHCAAELYDLTAYCHRNQIPVIFWNKEDPVFTDTFIPTAKRADAVFTTDLECVEKYKTELGHERVYHLHFAAQPLVHNPIEKYERKDRFCFAGAYYHRYQDRCRIFDAFSDYFIESRGFDIFDRNYLNARPEHKFPERYDPYILGKLDPSEIDVAYKGYVYGINMNSITQSQTMFARRVFELMASNTIVVGNYSRGVKNYFGDLTFCTDDEKTLRAGLERYCADRDSADKLRLLALRKVLLSHLVEDRLDYIVQKVFGKSIKAALPQITVYSRVENQKDADRIVALFQSQTYTNKKLLLVSDAKLNVPEYVSVMDAASFNKANAVSLCEGYLACFSADDWYGCNYLLDMALTLRYGDFDGIGKAEYFTTVDGIPNRGCNGQAYRKVQQLAARRSMVKSSLLEGLTGDQLCAEGVWSGENLMSIDAINYCEAWQKLSCAAAEDMVLADQGIGLDAMENAARRVKPLESHSDTIQVGMDVIAHAPVSKKDPIQWELKDNKIYVTSELPDGTHRYLYLNEEYNISEYLDDGVLGVLFRGEARMNLTGFCLFYDDKDNKLSHQSFKLGVRGKVTPPAETAYMKIAYRVYGPGSAVIENAEFGINIVSSLRGGCFLSRSNVLVLSNHYPAPDDLYRNMFVHKRLTAYKDQGILVDVMRMNPYVKDSLREFEGINIIEGQGEMLTAILNSGAVDTVCVHFLTEDMWAVLKNYLGVVRLIIWAHGADIQPWWRREFNYQTSEEIDKAKAVSEKREALWNAVFEAAQTADIQFVFVSKFFRDQVFEDYKVTLPEEKYHIIHNCIDTEQFTYVPKNAEDRKNILSIRPYASKAYANDLTVKAIQELAKEPWFDELKITLYGRGALLEEVVQPIRGFSNIHIEERFLTQSEIAQIHKKNGIFLVPSRMDTQGVARDEAMSSGLVPVTNAVAAIPEFVSEDCAILADGEDYVGMAEGIKRMYHNPELFLKLSENAAKRVRSQTSRAHTIDKELRIIFPGTVTAVTDVPVGGAETDDSSSDEDSHPQRVSIFGSCMSRDCFRVAPDKSLELSSYVARQSVVSAVSEPISLDMDCIHLSSAFQRRMVWQDFVKNTFNIFQNDGSKWLLLDLIDERFALAKVEDSYVTKSQSAVDGGVLSAQVPNIQRRLIGQDYYVEGTSLKAYIAEFCRRLLQIYEPDHVIIHRAFVSDRYVSLDGKVCDFDASKKASNRALNDLLKYMYDEILKQIPGAREIDCTNDYCASEAHVWGLAPVHYVDDYYRKVMEQLACITQSAGRR